MKSLHIICLVALLALSLEAAVQTADTPNESEHVYLFSYFKGNGEDGLHLAYSRNGLSWRSLKNDTSFLKPAVGGKLMRDPSICQGPDEMFHMVWTTGWNDKGIGLAHSKDLINWSKQEFLGVMEHEPEAKNCWAPEIFYDAPTQTYLIYWATTIPGRFTETFDPKDDNNHRIYYIATKDFQTFTKTQLFYDPGFNVIDSFIGYDPASKRYVMFLKNETKHPKTEKNIRVAFSDAAAGPYEGASEPITGAYWAEGPAGIFIDGRWIVYFDKYTEHRYGAVVSKDLKNWKDISDQVRFPEGIRHGTAFKMRADVLNVLEEQHLYPRKVERQVAMEISTFNLEDVQLLDGPFKQARERNAAWLLSMEPDRFLAWFRKEAGLDPKGQVYGGWERETIAGHSLGHYLSACAMMYASTGDERYKQRIDYIVDELALCQEKNGNGYVAAIPNGKRVFSEVAQGDIRSKGFDLNGCWVPWYTTHKVMAGLRDAYLYCGNDRALTVLTNMSEWAGQTTKNLTDEQWQTMLACEHGGMNEVLADVYALTSEQKHLKLAEKFYHKSVLDPLTEKKNKLAGLHANTQVPKVIGTASIYELTGQEKYRTISRFFWDTVIDHYTFVNGGNSANEYFGQPDKLSEPLHDTTETCNTYNMLKLTRHLFTWDPNARYMDYYERALYNHILAHQHPETGMVMYKGFLDMPARKTFSTPFDSFWCCVGTGMENHAKYNDSIYFHGDESLYVNLFIPSVLNWKDKGITVTQETDFPAKDTVTLHLTSEKPVELSLMLRKPAWTTDMSIKVNGRKQSAAVSANGYIELNRTFSDGDTIELQVPMTLHMETMPDKPNRVVFLYGPVVLAADLDGDDPLPVLVGDTESLYKAIRQIQPLRYKATDIGHIETADGWKEYDLNLIPLYAIADQRYTVYMDSFTPDQWLEKKAAYEAEKERLREIEACTIDKFLIGQMQPERDHNLTGENTSTGEFSGKTWRHAVDGGWFQFEMKVLPDTPMELVCTYWGSDAGGREFDLLIDGTRIAAQILDNNRPGEFFDVTYPIRATLTKDKETVTVRLQAKPGKTAGGLFGTCRMMRQTD